MSDPNTGLSASDVATRVALGQVNRAPSSRPLDYLDIVRRNTLTVFNAFVVPAAVALFVLGDYRGAWAVSAMAVANCVIGLTHELRAKYHLDRLQLLGESRVRVRRDNRVQTIPSGEIVREDCILLAVGETVAADGVVVRANYLEIDEALLTGESDPVARTIGQRVLSGSVCVGGEGEFIADRVGDESFANKLSTAARQYRYQPGPTQQTLDRLVRGLTVLAVIFSLGYVGLYFLRGFDMTELVQMIAATITSMVPQGLILLTTLVFVLSAVGLSRQGAVVQRLAAIEAMAALDVVCTDKTGTLTTGRQSVDRILTINESEQFVREWLAIFTSNTLDHGNKSIEAFRAALANVPTTAVKVLDQLPFKSRNRCSAMRVTWNGRSRLLVLGSFEALKPSMVSSEIIDLDHAWRELLPTGLRLLVFADGPGDDVAFEGALPAVPLRPVALISLQDELRPEAASVLANLHRQGIQFKVVSGDNPETVRATVRGVPNALSHDDILTGDDWANASDRRVLAEKCSVFGRVSPEQKLDLVAALQERGRHVGMIGDGVNDILPIKRADVGIAMGAGSPATKAVAGIVLESNSFDALPKILTEGRCVVQNIRRAAKLFLLKNVYTVALVLVAVGVCGLPFPYLPQQVTLLNALTIGGPALLILANRSKHAVAIRSSFLAEVGRFVLVAGVSTSIVALAMYLGFVIVWKQTVTYSRTVLLVMLILAGVGNAVVATQGDRRLIAWACFAVIVLAGALSLPWANDFFVLHPLGGFDWLVAVSAALAAIAPPFVDNRLRGDGRGDENR